MTKETSNLVDLGFGVMQQWLSDGNIMHITIPNSTRDVDRVAADALVDYFKSRDGSKVSLLAVEVTKNHIITPYGRQRFGELPKFMHPEMYGRVSVIVPPGVLGAPVRLFAMYTIGNAAPSRIEWKTHKTRDAGLAWLRELLTDTSI